MPLLIFLFLVLGWPPPTLFATSPVQHPPMFGQTYDESRATLQRLRAEHRLQQVLPSQAERYDALPTIPGAQQHRLARPPAPQRPNLSPYQRGLGTPAYPAAPPHSPGGLNGQPPPRPSH